MKSIIRALLLMSALAFLSSPAFAQATRTWVSGVGDDANPCSRTAPCKTFAGAISKTATGGVISVLDPGGYGAVTITKAITIDGGGIEGSVLVAGSNGININLTAAGNVTLRNLTVFGTNTALSGVRILSATNVILERVFISGMTNGVEQSSSGHLYIADSTISGNSSFGVISFAGKVTANRVRFENNTLDGFRNAGTGTAIVKNSVISGNLNLGISATAGTLAISDSSVANNVWGIGSITGATVTLANSSVFGSTNQGLYSDGAGQLISFGNNTLSGNGSNGSFTSTMALQ